MQIAGSCAELAPLKPELSYSGRVRHHYRQHFLVYINTCYFVGLFHAFLRTREESVPGK
jgi:hypothetical protein